MQSLQLEQLLPKLKIAKASVGELDGPVRLSARGNSIDAMLATANGETALLVGEGEVSDLILQLANLDIANTLGLLMRGDRNIPIHCLVADLAFEGGVMRPRQFIFDTAHTTLVGEGKANFADETLDLRLVAQPKDHSFLSLRGPIVVGGTFADPTVLPDMKRLTARGAAAAALGIVATPFAAIVPFIQLGKAEPVQCAQLVQAQGSARGGTPPRNAAEPFPGSGRLKDAIELCERLAGVERQICLQQARENRERALSPAPGIGATPGGGTAVSGKAEARTPAAR